MSIITAIRRNVKKTGRCSVYVDDAFFAACPIDVALAMGLHKGMEMTEERAEVLRREDRRIVMRQKLYRYATYKPRTIKQVKEKLQALDASVEEVDDVVAWLMDFDLVNDRLYAERFIEASRSRKPLSPVAIRQRLLAKGIDRMIVEDVMDAHLSDDDVRDAARRVAERRWATLRGDVAERRKRLTAFLQYRGYDWSTIKSVLSDLTTAVMIVVLSAVMTSDIVASPLPPGSPYNECNKERLPASVNAYQPTVQPVIGPDGRLYVDRKRHPDNMHGTDDDDEVWVSQLRSGMTWSEPVRAEFTGFRRPDVLFNFTHDGLAALIVGPYKVDRGDSVPCFAIAARHSVRETFARLEIISLPNVKTLGSNFFGHLSSDRSLLVVALQSEQDLDLFVSTRCDGGWTPLVSLGPTINTAGLEGAPWLADDGRTLYFASNGRDDRSGKSDLYMSRRLDESWTSWSTPRNLGRCLNTQEDETAISVVDRGPDILFGSWDAETARQGLYRATLPADLRPLPTCSFSLTAVDALTGDTLQGAQVEVVGPERMGECAVARYAVDRDVKRATMILRQGQRYAVKTAASGYVTHQQTVEIQNLDSNVHVHVTANLFSTSRPLASVYFDRDSYAVTDSARSVLQAMLESYDIRQIRFEVSGYTDAVGTIPHNAELSARRARAVADAMATLGLDRERIVPEGRGIEDGGITTRDEQPLSRRVDIYAAEP
jgi:OmpA-OmpF porin, OOP family